jgi:acetyltransferase-like isoleucine patch superfamily enzyme
VRGSLRELRREPARRALLRARVLRPYYQRRLHSLGRGSAIDLPGWLYGPHLMAIGDGCLILRGAWLAVEKPAWERSEPVLRIGQGVTMRPCCTISASESIDIEDYVVFGAHVSVVDSNHTHSPATEHERPGPHESVLHNPVDTAPIRIGRGTWLADGVSVLAGANIGAHCSIGANSVVRGAIPDYSIAVGAPARVVGSTRRV